MTREMTERQIDFLIQLRAAERDTTKDRYIKVVLVALGFPWARQVKAALEKRGMVKRDERYPGVVWTTDEGRVQAAVEKAMRNMRAALAKETP
jgi:hypothetical protein